MPGRITPLGIRRPLITQSWITARTPARWNLSHMGDEALPRAGFEPRALVFNMKHERIVLKLHKLSVTKPHVHYVDGDSSLGIGDSATLADT